jgi:hypothetical protein
MLVALFTLYIALVTTSTVGSNALPELAGKILASVHKFGAQLDD